MQWDDSPGAGFSDAPLEEFYAPLIGDETYGYEKVNVDAQRKAANSLLNRLRRMIQVRKNYLVFGRGGMQLVDAQPKSVLAYLRTSVNETMCILNNLSSESQDVTVQLSEHEGTAPIDVLTGKRLPQISRTPYTLTLEPYDYRWLRL
jgi:maltose alpha-D-glucosyltransferase/alpha-amylase